MSEQKLLLETARFSVVDMPAGPDLPDHRRQVIRHPGSVVLVPLVDEDHVCLIRNYRVSVDRQLVELPAGTREANEAAEVTAHRELIEETGYQADSLQQLSSFLPAPGILDERMVLYLARGLHEGPPQRQPGEQIENWIVPWDEAMGLIDSGQIEDAKTMVGLLLWDRQRRAAS